MNEFRNVKCLGRLAPIQFFTTLFILNDLAHCFKEHIFDLHVDFNNFKEKSKFVNLYDDKYIPFDLCCITFLLPDFTKLSRRHAYGNFWTYIVLLKFFPSKVGWYCDKLGNKYKTHWVKGVFVMAGESIKLLHVIQWEHMIGKGLYILLILLLLIIISGHLLITLNSVRVIMQ